MKKYFLSINDLSFNRMAGRSNPNKFIRLFLFCVLTFTGLAPNLHAQADCCDQGDKPNSLTIIYKGSGCSATNTTQSTSKYSCNDVGGGPSNDPAVYIKVAENEDGSGNQYFAGNVAINSSFTPTSANAGDDSFKSNTWFLVYASQGGSLLQKVKIHTSCSAPLVPGEQFGSLFLLSATFKNNVNCGPATPPEQCPVPVITINSSQGSNNTTVCKNEAITFVTTEPACNQVVLTWNFGPGASPQTATGKGPHTVTYSTTGTATVTLTADNNCDGGTGVTVCEVPPPPPVGSDCCDSYSGKPKKLRLTYTGQGCSATNTTQSTSKYSCDNIGSGPNNDPSVYIKVAENEDGSGKIYFTGNVSINTDFTANAGLVGDNEFKSNTWFLVYSSQGGSLVQKVKIHTSCSAPLVPGEQFGSLRIVSAEWSNGSVCDINNSGSGGSGGSDCCDQGDKPNSLTIKYNGESCSNTSTSQGTDKYSCANVGNGPNGDPNVYIKVAENEDGSGKQYFAGNVAINGTFTPNVSGTGDDSFKSNTWFLVYANQGGSLLQKVKIHTSCSAPLVAGDQFGSLELQSATFKNGVSCGPTTPPGPNCLDCSETATITITKIDCVCIGQGGDSDGDGVCNNQDCAPFDPNFPKPPGTACNDNNPNTTNDVIQADGCSCAGTPVNPCANQGGDSDGDGVCNNQDCKPFDPFFPATPGSPCNDGNPNTVNDKVTADGCSCAGTPVSTCNVTVNGCVITITGLNASNSAKIFDSNWNILFDCNPWTGNFCGSNISFTVPSNGNYWVQACGSTTSYTVSNCTTNPCANQGGDTDGDGVCNNQDCAPTNPNLPTTPGTACNDGNPNTTNDVIQADGCSCAGTPVNPCANQGGDSDGDGVCNNQDCAPFDPAFPKPAGTPCNDGNPNTINDVIQANGCTCAGTPVQVCDNVTNGGVIGFGATCLSSISIPCNTAPPTINNCTSPTGGSGALETIWLKSTTSCSAPTTTAAEVIAGLDPHWVWIPGATSLTYSPGVISQNTCFLRCTRRAGCTSYIESTIISVSTDCGGGGTPNCANITISASNGTITVGNLGATPFASVKVFNSNWGTVFSCYANCSGPTVTVNVGTGTYYVYAGYVGSNYQLICETNKTVIVPGGNPCANQGGDSDGDGVCNNQDCQPNNPAFPATPGTPCNDGNPNTTNDVVTADGCGCAGTTACNLSATFTVPSGCLTDAYLIFADANDPYFPPNNPNYTYTYDIQPASSIAGISTVDPRSVTVSFNSAGIKTVTATITNPAIPNCQLVKQATFTVSNCNNPCANQGGDSDGDGVCNNQDCQPNNPAFPATPGTACNDGNANTTNDVVTADGCGCAGTPVNNGCTATTLVTYTMQACNSCSGTSSPANWSELTPTYSGNGGCSGLTATAISPKVNGDEHSCTPRSNGNALCTGAGNTMRFSVTLPNGGDLSGISFYEQAPAQYVFSSTSNTNCSGSTTGSNNPPTKFDLKVFKGNTQVFSQTYNTQSTWNLRNVSFAGNTAFSSTSSTTYTFEFTPHTTTGSGSVKAWDIDEIAVMGCCGGNTGGTGNCNNITITPGVGKITVSGLNGTPITSLQVFNSTWTQTLFSCFGGCNATEVVNVGAGTYNVLAKYYNSSWTPICEKSMTVTVASALLGSEESFKFEAVKHPEHAELNWVHSRGDLVTDYILEKSVDGNHFEPIADQVSEGTKRPEFYQGYDLEPALGDNFYRVRMELKDGEVAYSEVKTINFPDLVDFVLFPNPASDFVKVNLETEVGEPVTITIYNNLGVLIKTFRVDEVYGKYYQMDIQELREGHYIVWINREGKRPVAKTLMVGKP